VNKQQREYLSAGHGFAGDEQFGVDGVQVPLEVLAAEVLAQRPPRADVPEVALVVAYPLVVVLGVLVQPHFGQTNGIPPQHVHAAAPLVRRALPEDVTDVGTRHDLQGAPAHPRLERQLQILAAPDVEAVVVRSQSLEEFLQNNTHISVLRKTPQLFQLLLPSPYITKKYPQKIM
jgi:hypothetical protein